MKIAFIHYHLKTGGVTSVIRQQAAALQAAGGRSLVLSAHRDPPDFDTPWAAVPGLAYDGLRNPELCALEVADALEDAIRAHWPRGADVLHVHNPTLAKNSLLQDILGILKKRGHILLCQIHDFAEDGRPEAYFQQPYTADCHYAVLNHRDYNLLLDCGLQGKGLHLLPNPVVPLEARPGPSPQKAASVLYPVRAIRRKNIGEALLLSRFLPPRTPLTITLPPNSPQDVLSYHDWKRFSAEHRMNACFDAGLAQDFKSLVGACSFILTTSITEGFGYAFLEAWTGSRSVWGRLLPAICSDFMEQGIKLDHLYTRLEVPLAWLDSDSLARRWQHALLRAATRFGQPLPAETARKAWGRLTGEGLIDYGLLHEAFQKQVLCHLLRHPGAANDLIAINPFLAQAGPGPDLHHLVDHNRSLVERLFSRKIYRRNLMQIYRRVTQTRVSHHIDKDRLAAAFLAPPTFSLLKWASYDG